MCIWEQGLDAGDDSRSHGKMKALILAKHMRMLNFNHVTSPVEVNVTTYRLKVKHGLRYYAGLGYKRNGFSLNNNKIKKERRL